MKFTCEERGEEGRPGISPNALGSVGIRSTYHLEFDSGDVTMEVNCLKRGGANCSSEKWMELC